MQDSEGRVALVTGAAGGIGQAVCGQLAADGLKVIVSDLRLALAKEVAGNLGGSGHLALECDVTDEDSVAAMFAAAREVCGKVDVMVAAAGLLVLKEDGDRPPITQTGIDQWHSQMAVNAKGCFLCIRDYLRQWDNENATLRPQHGRIVTFASVAAQLGGYRSPAAYIASKGAVLSLTKAAAREASHLGVTVNAIAPGLIETAMLRQTVPDGGLPAAENIPLGRLGSPADVAGAVSFLASPGSAYVTGAVIDVNGGYRMA